MEQELFRPLLSDFIEMDHEQGLLSEKIDWTYFVLSAVLEAWVSVDVDPSDVGPDAEAPLQLRGRDACEGVGDELVHAVFLRGSVLPAPFPVRSKRLGPLPQSYWQGRSAEDPPV